MTEVLTTLILIVANLTGVRCNTYEFIITGIANIPAPTSIFVITSDQITNTVPLTKVTGNAAHYVFQASGRDLLPGGTTAYIDSTWEGNFVQSDCIVPTAVTLSSFSAESGIATYNTAGMFLIATLVLAAYFLGFFLGKKQR